MLLNNKVRLLILLIVMCLITGTLAQRGGGRSSSRSRSSRSRSHKKTYTNCTTVKGKTICYDDDDDDDSGFGFTTFLGILFLGGVKVYDYVIKAINAADKKQIIQIVMNDFTKRMNQQPSTLDKGAKQEMVRTLKGKSYNMVLKTRAKNDPTQCRLTISFIDKVTDSQYKIQMRGNDEFGSSKFQGLLFFKDDGIAWKLAKQYDSKKRSGQTGSFDSLFYEGSGKPDRLDGRWAFYGHESEMQYSGTWYAVPA